MKKTMTPTSAPGRTTGAKTKSSNPANPTPARPGGKLGLMMDRLAAKTGATAEDLIAATGWQKHSVLGGLSKLRARGFALRVEERAGRTTYRFEPGKT